MSPVYLDETEVLPSVHPSINIIFREPNATNRMPQTDLPSAADAQTHKNPPKEMKREKQKNNVINPHTTELPPIPIQPPATISIPIRILT
jgi:hypothetical protein